MMLETGHILVCLKENVYSTAWYSMPYISLQEPYCHVPSKAAVHIAVEMKNTQDFFFFYKYKIPSDAS